MLYFLGMMKMGIEIVDDSMFGLTQAAFFPNKAAVA